jgi:hypothetical protein
MSMMVVFAPAALAHHSYLNASSSCANGQINLHVEAFSWTNTTGDPGRYNSNIEIRLGSTTGTLLGSGKFLPANSGQYVSADGYDALEEVSSFAGTGAEFAINVNGNAYAGQTLTLYSGPKLTTPDSDWWNSDDAGPEDWSSTTVTVVSGCSQGVSVSANPQVCALNQQGVPQGGVSFGINPVSGATVQVFSNSNFTGAIGGPLGNGVALSLSPGTYYWQATPGSGFTMNGASSGQFTIAPCGASVAVVSGACVVGPNGVPLGQAQVTINPTSGATVVLTGLGGPYNFSGSGGSQLLAPGVYNWQATPAPGFTLTGPGSGQITIDPCTASVSVSNGVCEVLGGPVGTVEVTIDPDDGATVTIYADAAMTDEVATFDDDGGDVDLPPGTYYWEASAEDGFELEGEVDGEFTIAPCEASTVVVSGGCALNDAGLPVGLVEVTVDPNAGATVVVSGPGGPYEFSASGSREVTPGNYSWKATAASGFTLTGDTSGEFEIEPCDVSVMVAVGVCEVVDGPFGSVAVFIDADSGAQVTVYDTEMNVAAAFNGNGGTSDLAPGIYTWVAVPGDGFEFPEGQATSGEFTIAPCSATVSVSQGVCQVGDGPLGTVVAEIDPASGATVVVRDLDLTVLAMLSGTGGSVELAPGNYTWTVEASDGFTVVGETSGAFTIVPCDASVIVTHGNCVAGAPTAYGSVTVGINPMSGATVTIFNSNIQEVAAFDSDGGNEVLVAGDYTWNAVASPGYDLTGATSGAFEVVACDDEVGGIVVLPFTGIDSEVLLGASILLLGMGIYLIHIARRGEEG